MRQAIASIGANPWQTMYFPDWRRDRGPPAGCRRYCPIPGSCRRRACEVCRKLGEEAIETVIAGLGQNTADLRAEAADLLYHLLVLLEVRSVPLADVLATLEARMSQSGLAEKASRKPS